MSVHRSAAIAALIASVAIIHAADAAAQQLDMPFRVQAGGVPIDVDGGHAAPYVADFDGDGVRDLLVGQFAKGRCRVYKNLGTNVAPRFHDFRFFEAGGRVAEVQAN